MNPIDTIVDNESRLACYALEYVASPRVDSESKIRALLDRVLSIEEEVLVPMTSKLGLGADVFGNTAQQLRQLREGLSAGRTRFSDVAEAVMITTSRQARDFREVVLVLLEKELSENDEAQFELLIAPFGDDYHVSA